MTDRLVIIVAHKDYSVNFSGSRQSLVVGCPNLHLNHQIAQSLKVCNKMDEREEFNIVSDF